MILSQHLVGSQVISPILSRQWSYAWHQALLAALYARVHQGAVLSPLLFSIYINDILAGVLLLEHPIGESSQTGRNVLFPKQHDAQSVLPQAAISWPEANAISCPFHLLLFELLIDDLVDLQGFTPKVLLDGLVCMRGNGVASARFSGSHYAICTTPFH